MIPYIKIIGSTCIVQEISAGDYNKVIFLVVAYQAAIYVEKLKHDPAIDDREKVLDEKSQGAVESFNEIVILLKKFSIKAEFQEGISQCIGNLKFF